MTEDYKKGYRDGFMDGWNEAQKGNNPWVDAWKMPPSPKDASVIWPQVYCSKCGIPQTSTFGCYRHDCEYYTKPL